MNIAGYRFGRIEIDGRTYTSDVVITPERDETRRHLEVQGIQVCEARTREAVQDFNRLQKESIRVVAALHLTC